ncbi:MAG: DMT family transporter [Pseudomonadota bacterium]
MSDGGVRPESGGAGLKGILCMAAGCALVTFNDAILKWLTTDMPVGQIMFIRGLFVFLPVLLLAWHEGGLYRLRVRSPRGQAARAAIVVTGMFLFITGLSLLPFAEAIALTFASPLFATALAVPFLKEKVGWRRWTAVGVGFGGVLVMLRPGEGALALAALLPLAAAVTGALRDIVTRRLSVSDSSSSILMVSTIAVTLCGLLTWPFGWPTPTWLELALLALAGMLLGAAQYLMIEAVRLAEVGLVAPFRYTSLIWAFLIGFVVFGSVPDIWVVIGAVVVMLSGLYILHREGRFGRRPSVPDRPESAPIDRT